MAIIRLKNAPLLKKGKGMNDSALRFFCKRIY